jgi:hypothetical protein
MLKNLNCGRKRYMKRKIFVLVITLVITTTSFVFVPVDLNVKASEDFGDPDLGYIWIYDRINDLTNITLMKDYWNRSRYFGSDGEQKASGDILNWMTNLSLENVTTELINERWVRRKGIVESTYLGELERLRAMKEYYLQINVRYKNNLTLKETRYFADDYNGYMCTPYHMHKLLPIIKYLSILKIAVPVVETLELGCTPSRQMLVVDENWTDPYSGFTEVMSEIKGSGNT